MNKYLFFVQKKDNKYGKMVREMDCIHLRGWINRRTTEAQSRHINWFGMYTVNNNNKIGTCTSYPSLLQRLGFTLFMTQLGRLLIVGFSFFAQGVSPLRKWTFGQVIITPPLFFSHFFLTWTTSPCYSNLFNVSWVGTDNEGQLKAVVRSQKH